MVRPQILMYPRRMALRRVVLEGEPRAREMNRETGEDETIVGIRG